MHLDEDECEDIHISLCQDLPYNRTMFPNILSHASQDEAHLELQQFIPFVNAECSKELKPFLCSIFLPQCSSKGFITAPCKALCLNAREGCETFMNRIGMRWPEKLSCDNLPEDSCFSMVKENMTGKVCLI